MARTVSLAVLACLALAAPTAACAQQAEPPRASVARDRLPILGTVGDLPPERERLVVEAAPGPVYGLGGRAVELDRVRAAVGAAARDLDGNPPPRASKLHVVVRADRGVHWQDVQWLLQACASERVNRILFAALPEDGGEEGAMALFLPTDAGAAAGGRVAPAIPVRLRASPVSAGDPGPTVWARLPRDAHGRISCAGTRAVLDADPGVSTGAVLETVDALLRGGLKGITLRGTKPQFDAITPRGEAEARPEVSILQKVAEPPVIGEPTLPRVARVRGALAGQAEAPVLGATATAGPFVVSEEGPDDETGRIGTMGGMFGGRRSGSEERRIAGLSEAVKAGLDWLKNHQSPGGFWDCDGFEAMCRKNKCGNPGGPLFDPGVSGLALLAFLGTGETHKTPTYGHVVRNGLKYLKGIQDAEGCFGPRTSNHFTYNHAIAALAMCEAYGLTQSPLFKSTSQNGVNFVLECRNPYMAWRYGVRPQDNDTSVTGWMVTALKAAQMSGLDVDAGAYEGAIAWLDKVTEPEYGRTGYTARGNGPARPQELMDRFPMDKSESLTAIGVFVRYLCGKGSDDALAAKGAALLEGCLPRYDTGAGTIDYYYWYYGSLAARQVGGDLWTTWEAAMKTALLAGQERTDGDDRKGSWEPTDPWMQDGGRIYSTAMGVLCLETSYRYGRFGK